VGAAQERNFSGIGGLHLIKEGRENQA